jgi:hypothetical protein
MNSLSLNEDRCRWILFDERTPFLTLPFLSFSSSSRQLSARLRYPTALVLSSRINECNALCTCVCAVHSGIHGTRIQALYTSSVCGGSSHIKSVMKCMRSDSSLGLSLWSDTVHSPP